jgi:hypothetical protein
VPARKTDEFALSPILAYSAPAAVQDPQGQLPFSISHLRFTPRGAQSVDLRQGDQLPLVFQLWMGSKPTDSPEANKIQLRYVFGTVSATHEKPAEELEEVDASNRDKAGNLLTGHHLDTSALGPGTYRVVVSATRETDRRTAYAAINLKVTPASESVDFWTAYGPSNAQGEALDDFKRGLSAEANGAGSEAEASYTRALAEAPTDPRPLEKLASLLDTRGNSDELVKLGQQPILVKTAVSPATLLPITKALRDHGNTRDVVRILEAQIKLQPPSSDLYRTLADACEAAGDSGRARDLRTLANAIK